MDEPPVKKARTKASAIKEAKAKASAPKPAAKPHSRGGRPKKSSEASNVQSLTISQAMLNVAGAKKRKTT